MGQVFQPSIESVCISWDRGRDLRLMNVDGSIPAVCVLTGELAFFSVSPENALF